MSTEMTYPHTFENGITLLRVSPRGAKMISDGCYVAWIQGCWMKEDGHLTPCGQKALLESNQTVEQMEEREKQWMEKKAEEKRQWEQAREEGKKLVTLEIAKGILKSAGTFSWKYASCKGYDMYHHLCTRWAYIPKSQLKVERKNNKVYCTLPKWMAEKHSIFASLI